MKQYLRSKRALLGTPLLALLVACSGGTRDDNQTAQANSEQPANESTHAMPSGPFAQAEMQMNERMMAAVGANASETWVRKMIEHHRGAVTMSQILIDQGGEQRFVEMARTTVEKQQREIGELERMLAGGISGGSGEANRFGPIEQSMHQQMMAASGSNISETWARKMIAHHRGAVDMSETLIRHGGAPKVLATARRTAEDQRREIAHLEAMLRGEAMPAGAAASANPAPAKERAQDRAAPEARKSDATPKAKAAEGPPQRDQAKSSLAPKASPSPSPTPTCAPEHRALGHC